MYSLTQKPSSLSPSPLIPRFFSRTISNSNVDLKLIWSSCHPPFVPPKWNMHCWKVLQTVYHTHKCTNLQILCKYCCSPDTLLHCYFVCPSVSPVWSILNSLFPSSTLTQGNQVDWFFLSLSCFINHDLRVVMFLTALWLIHTAFLETVNSSQPYLALPIQRMSSNISLVFSNILFGTNWPRSLQDCIKGWPSPWFLSVVRLNM